MVTNSREVQKPYFFSLSRVGTWEFFILFYVYGWFAHMYVSKHRLDAWCHWRPEENSRPLEPTLQMVVDAGTRTWVLQQQQVLLTTGPTL